MFVDELTPTEQLEILGIIGGHSVSDTGTPAGGDGTVIHTEAADVPEEASTSTEANYSTTPSPQGSHILQITQDCDVFTSENETGITTKLMRRLSIPPSKSLLPSHRRTSSASPSKFIPGTFVDGDSGAIEPTEDQGAFRYSSSPLMQENEKPQDASPSPPPQPQASRKRLYSAATLKGVVASAMRRRASTNGEFDRGRSCG